MENQNKKTLGLISVICAGIAWFAFGIVLGIVAIVTGALSFNTTTGKIGLIVGVIEILMLLAAFGA